jgi:quinoprotein glucose dehydrogenase
MVPSVAQSAPSPSLIDNPVYKNNCVTCHGTTAKGHFFGPSLASDKAAAASADQLRNIITNGKGRMPKHAGKLTPEQIDTLVLQIQAMNKK